MQIGIHYTNCGGKKPTVANVEYEDVAGPVKFYYVENWGFSITGCLWDVDNTSNQMTIQQLMNPYLQWTIPKYMQVYDYLLFRSHYARCLVNGNYTVKLHFAEDLITQVHKQQIFLQSWEADI